MWSHMTSIAESGEDAVLAAIREVIDPPHNAARSGAVLDLGPGDDAAVLRLTSPRVVMTTDTLSEDQDFRRSWWDSVEEFAADVGTKAAAQNLSDINAMGATTTALLVSLTLPGDLPLAWVPGFYRGVMTACEEPGAQGCVIAGGDLGSGKTISVTITALGELAEQRPALVRSGAQSGDVLTVCGRLGFAAAGLALLESGHRAGDERWIAAQKRPAPPLTAGPAALAAGASAGMDLSDGLLRDTQRLARASDVVVRLADEVLEAEATWLAPAAHALGEPQEQAVDWVLSGGEDYGLLATFSAETVIPEGFRAIGSIEPADDDGPGVLTGLVTDRAGWDSLRR